MIEGKYDIVFRGQTVKSFELDDVKSNLVKLFKSTPDAINKLFSGEEVPIRKGLDYTAAMKYQSALKSAGALALIKEVAAEESPPTQETKPALSDNNQETQIAAENQDALSIAQVGTRLLPPKVYEHRQVDTSGLSLAKVGEKILPDKPAKEYAQPNIDHLSLIK